MQSESRFQQYLQRQPKIVNAISQRFRINSEQFEFLKLAILTSPFFEGLDGTITVVNGVHYTPGVQEAKGAIYFDIMINQLTTIHHVYVAPQPVKSRRFNPINAVIFHQDNNGVDLKRGYYWMIIDLTPPVTIFKPKFK